MMRRRRGPYIGPSPILYPLSYFDHAMAFFCPIPTWWSIAHMAKINPYPGKKYTKIDSVKPYFQYDAASKCMIFTGDTLEVRVPARFAVYGLLDIGNTVTTLAIADLIINDQYQTGLVLMAKIEMEVSDMSTLTIGGVPYMVFHLKGGDRFIKHTEVIKNSGIVYAVFTEFLARGKIIYTINYDNITHLFDQIKHMNDSNLGVDHAVFEMIYSYLWRSTQNRSVQYRHTPMTDGGTMISLRNVADATSTTTSKLAGSYFDVGLTSALIYPNDQPGTVEEMLR